MAISHIKTTPVADFTGTVTVFNSAGNTTTAAATDLIRPSDWNTAHNFFQTISGNTAGQSTASGTNLVFGGTNGITASLSTAAGAATLWMSGNTDYAATNHSHGNPTLALTNLSGTTASNSAGLTLSLSAAAPGGGGAINVSAGTTSGNLQTVVFSNANSVSFGLNGSTITASAGHQVDLTYIPYYPGSTSSQTIGGLGATSASAWFWPVSVVDPVRFNELRILQSGSVVTTSNSSGLQTITSQFGLYSQNGGTLSQIVSGSFSIAVTMSSVSGTFSYPTSTGTNGYGYDTSSVTGTAQAQSLFGTVGNRVVGMQFGNTLELSGGLYFLGIHQRQSTSNTAAGLSTAFVGNVFGAAQSIAPLGSASSAHTAATRYGKFPWGVFTVSQSSLPNTVPVSQINASVAVVPLLTFIST